MYIIFSLASLLYIINYAKEPIHNDVIDRPWMLIILSKLLKERRENDFINNLIVSFELSYLTFLVTIFIISPVLTNHFMQENIYVFNLLNAALIVSML
tara:strand:+ start:2068 stop:2361 length:294 start_codon:yes stop_codon:yes gene_type:complete